MVVKEIKTVFNDYKKTGLLVAFPTCDFKCCKEAGLPISVCQNCEIANSKDIEVPPTEIVKLYNPSIHKALIIGGLEPLDSTKNLLKLILSFRFHRPKDDVVVYTGYNIEEIPDYLLTFFINCGNIILKVGRFVPNDTNRYDEVLGVTLASTNQYGINIDEYFKEEL